MRIFHLFRATTTLFAVISVQACGDLPDPSTPPATQLKAETKNLGNGKFVTTLRLPISTDGARLQHCAPNGPCLWAMFQHLDQRVSIYRDAYIWHLRLDNPTDHPVSAKWSCAKYQEGYVGDMRGEGSLGIYPPGFTGEPRPGGMACGYFNPSFRPQWVEVTLEWLDHDVNAAAWETDKMEKSRQQTAQLVADDRLQLEFADKMKRIVREEAKFTLAPNFTVFVHSESVTLEGSEHNDFASTVSRIEFRDHTGAVLYRDILSTKVMDYRNGTYGFVDSCSVSFKERVLASSEPHLIEMRLDCEPSAPGYTRVRWYGLDAAGQFRAVHSPLDGFSGGLTDLKQHPGLKPGRIYAVTHTGYAGVVVPYTFNRQNFSLEPDFSERFLFVEDGSAFHIKKNLRLLLRNQPQGKVITTLVLTPASKSRFLRAYVEKAVGNDWLDSAPWMEIEVDGQRGWVNLRDDEGLRDALQWSG